MIGYTCAWCGGAHLGVDCPLPRPHSRKDDANRLAPRLRKREEPAEHFPVTRALVAVADGPSRMEEI
jgi:hypothetical protein